MSQFSLPFQEKFFTHLGNNCTLKGEFWPSGVVKISSLIQGNIYTSSEEDFITIEQGGSVEGKVVCHHIEIKGRMSGEIQSTGKVVIMPLAQVDGLVSSHTLIIHPGSLCNITAKTTSHENNQKTNHPT